MLVQKVRIGIQLILMTRLNWEPRIHEIKSKHTSTYQSFHHLGLSKLTAWSHPLLLLCFQWCSITCTPSIYRMFPFLPAWLSSAALPRKVDLLPFTRGSSFAVSALLLPSTQSVPKWQEGIKYLFFWDSKKIKNKNEQQGRKKKNNNIAQLQLI